MTTETVAARLVALFNEGKAAQAQEELYGETVVTHEQNGTTTSGKEAVMAATASFFGGAEIRAARADLAFVNQDTFLVKFYMDVTIPGMGDMVGDEYGFYRVAEGKVVEEYFYMMPLAA